MGEVLKIQGLSVSYGKNRVLSDLNLQLNQGDVYGLIGKNGAGKSTLMKAIVGSLASYTGEIIIEGKSVHTSRNIGCIVETSAFYPELNAMDNMLILADSLQDRNKQELRSLLELVGLDPNSRKKAKHFSLGMKQRLGIALSLVGDPPLLVLDEPMNGLDPSGIREMRELLHSLSGKGKTILISSHILGELDKTATKFGFLVSGRIVDELSQEQIIQSGKELEQYYIEYNGETK